MNELFLITADFLKGEKIFTPLRRALSILFCIGVASFVYEKAYGNYILINITDYTGIVNFFVQGHFFIPLFLFSGVIATTYALSFVFFSIPSFRKTNKWKQQIAKYETSEQVEKYVFSRIATITKQTIAVEMSKSYLQAAYSSIKDDIPEDLYQQVETAFYPYKQDIKYTFRACIRCLFAVTVYYQNIIHWGWLLYGGVTLFTVFLMIICIQLYNFVDVLPALVSKVNTEADRILNI